MSKKDFDYFSKMCDKVEASHDSILTIKEDIRHIRKSLEGNGKEGLINKTERMDAYIVGLKAQFAMSKFVFGGGLFFSVIALALALAKFFGVS